MHHAINRSVKFWTSQFIGSSNGKLNQLRIFDPKLLSIGGGSATSRTSHSSQVSHPSRASQAPPAAQSDDQSSSALGNQASKDTLGQTGQEAFQSRSSNHAAADQGDQTDQGRRSLKGLLPQARFFSGEDIAFDSIAESAQDCTPGQLVVYRIGLDCPVELIADALARGAAGILTEQILPVPLPQCIVADTDRAIAEITSRELIDENGTRPDQRLLTIGVAGESGKTSTALCLATVLHDIPCRVAYETDLGHSDGIGSETSDQPVPFGKELLQRISEAADAGAAITILELNDDLLRSGGYDQIGLDMLVITGRNRQRSDFGPSAIDCAIERVLPDGVLVANVSDTIAINLAMASGLTLLTYGVDTQADVSLKTIKNEDGVLTAMIRHEMNSAMMESMIGFGFFTTPLAAAAAVGIATENPLVQIAESISQLRSIPGRCERVVCQDWDKAQKQPEIFVDACGSPERAAFVLECIRSQVTARDPIALPINGMAQAKQSVAASKSGQIWCVLAPSVADNAETLMKYGRLLETLPDHCIVSCDPTDKSGFLAMSHAVLDGVQDCAAMRLVADQERAIRWAMQSARPQDTIVVLGGIDRSSPMAQRSNVERLTNAIAKFQAELERDLPASDPNASNDNHASHDNTANGKSGGSHPTNADSTGKPKLKLFHPEA